MEAGSAELAKISLAPSEHKKWSYRLPSHVYSNPQFFVAFIKVKVVKNHYAARVTISYVSA